jgi:hypothetical protein
MLRYRAWAAAVALGAGALAYAADPPAPRSGVRAVGGTPKTASVMPPSALPAETVQAAVKAEFEAWERRVGVCLRLRQIALDRNDEALMRQADELEQRANALYQARVSALGVPKVKAPLPPSSAALELLPEKPLDAKAAAAKLVAPAPPVPAGETAEVREVKP